MSYASGIKAGEAFVELLTDDSKLVKGLKSASRKLKAFGDEVSAWGTSLAAAGAAVAVPMLGFAKVFASGSEEIVNLSKRTGISVEALSRLRFAAEHSGTSMEALDRGIGLMEKTLYRASSGSKAAVDALAHLGLTVEQLSGLSADQQFKVIADRLAQIPGAGLRAALAMTIFGRGARELLPLMERGAAGISEFKAEADRLGLTISTQDAEAGKKFNEVLKTLEAVLKKAAMTIGSALVPMLTQWATKITETLVTTIKWIKGHQDLIVGLFKLGLALMAAGAALLILGKTATLVGAMLSTMSMIVGIVSTACGVLVSALGLLVTPLGILVIACGSLVAAIASVILWFKTGGDAAGWLGRRFAELRNFAVQSFGGILDALKAGDFSLAAKILWLSLKVAWMEGVGALKDIWFGFWAWIKKMWSDMIDGFAAVGAEIAHAAREAWNYVTGASDEEKAGEQQRYAERMGKIGQRNINREGEIDAQEAARQKKAQDDLDAAKKAWQDAIKEAHDKAAQPPDAEAAPASGGPFQVPDLAPARAALDETKAASAGSFSAAAIPFLARGLGTNELLLQSTKEIEKNTKKIADRDDEEEFHRAVTTIAEKLMSRSSGRGDSAKVEIVYIVDGTSDDIAVKNLTEATAPGSWDGLVRTAVTVEPLGPNLWEAKAHYGRRQKQPDTNDNVFTFETTGGTLHIDHSLNTWKYGTPDNAHAPDFQGAINVGQNGAQGVDITVPVYQFAETWYIPAALVTDTYKGTLYALTGTTNIATFRGCGPVECLFLGASGSYRTKNEDWEVTFRFAASPTKSNFTVGTGADAISVAEKKGWHYMWVRWESVEVLVDSNSEGDIYKIAVKPVGVYIEQVYESADFDDLGITLAGGAPGINI